MKLFFSVECPEGSLLTAHCPDFHTLNRRIQDAICEAVWSNTTMPSPPVVTRLKESVICERCAAPLLPSGACSSLNCQVGKPPFKRKGVVKLLADSVPGVTTADKLPRR